MQINRDIFKAYDIRGIYPAELNEDVARAIGRAAPSIIAKGVSKPRFLIAGDARLSTPALKKALAEGLAESGADVDDAGMLSTPTFYLVSARGGYDGGIQVSASHNPKEWNGFKLVGTQGIAIGFVHGLNDMLAMIEEDRLPPKAKTKGSITTIGEAGNEALKQLAAELQRDASHQIKPFKVVIDPGNGMGSLDMRALFATLPCTVIWMNEEPDGTFPAHPPDPLVLANTADLRARIIEEKADLGIASDGDGDRYFFFDEWGERVAPEVMRGIFAELELKRHPGGAVVCDVRPGKISHDMIESAGGKTVLAPVGHSLIKEVMRNNDAIFGGEGSGHFFYKLPEGTFEAPLVLVHRLLEFLSSEHTSFSKVVAPYKDRYSNSGEQNVKLSDRKAGETIVEALKKKYEDGEQSTLDGLSVAYHDVWFNVRLSNTEPLIRFIVESPDPARMERMRDELHAFIKAANGHQQRGTPALRITDLKKTYASGTAALNGVSIEIPEGDFFALLGPNGAGKTTLIGIATGLVNKTSGTVEVFGHDIDKETELAKTFIGLVGQEINFNPFEKLIDIVVNQGGYYGIPRSVALPRAKQLLTDLGLGDKIYSTGMQLSGGMKRRLMIARALIHQPKFLILDEPTAGVDVELRRGMWDYLKTLTKEGLTILLTTHYLEEAEQLAKHVAIINKGQIIVNDSIENVLAMHKPTGEAKEGYRGSRLEEVFLKLIKEQKS